MIDIRKKYEANFLRNELIISLILIGIIISIVEYNDLRYLVCDILENSREALYTSVASISGAILGFIIAGVSIIFALIGSQKLKRVRESSHYKDIYKTYISAIKYLAISTFSAIIGILLDKDISPNVWVFYINLWAIIISTLRVWRCVWILENLIDLIANNSE